MLWRSSTTSPGRRLHRPLAVLAAGLVATLGTSGAVGAASVANAAGPRPGPAPLLAAGPGATAIKDNYIVVLRGNASAAKVRSVRGKAVAAGGRVHHSYATALKGFAANLSGSALAKVRANPDVKYVEPDQRVSIATTQSPRPGAWTGSTSAPCR